ncbi:MULTISPECIES: amidohydrolase family protein [Achromobacter]|uniref:Amidohydrolase-related domain-containing protein n=1 Tax=Achromobacter piechaudii TaxID=72556 RepID=A0A6S7EPF0_9BURK|nr:MULTISPECIES: amidohydrolase family protein [Achromobacter]MPS79491.1 hypothetical protein [Achromobacter sp.]CAB3920870.1 hypothetical protein LMG1861_05396 [Achromobacter piechaudii]
MQFFDTHLHLCRPDRAGLDELLTKLETLPQCLGGLLVLNTPEEVEIVHRHIDLIPSRVVLVPYLATAEELPAEMMRSGWFKIHPALHKLTSAALPGLSEQLTALAPRGVMVHCFPWGTQLQYSASLPIVIHLAQTLPDSTILATHGGGYESWRFRAHAGGLKNVHFDFSMTLDYYEGADAVKPLQRYLMHSPTRLHFGSDWPSGNIERQLGEQLRLAREVGVDERQLEALLLNNARAQWPEAFAELISLGGSQ